VKIEILTSGPSHWYRLVSTGNGFVLMQSEMYANKQNAKRAGIKTATALGLDWTCQW